MRPEDLLLYEEYFDGFKLATRATSDPVKIMDAYLAGHYKGSIPALLEPDHSGLFYPYLLENSRLPENFGKERLAGKFKSQWVDFCKVNL